MKRIIILMSLSLCTLISRAEERVQKDTAVLNALTAKLYEYFEAMKYEPVQVQMGECDFLIESISDSLLRNHIARTIYDHYAASPVMGAEAVAIYVYDKWYKPGFVKMSSDEELLGAKIFAEFNRMSQIGCRAPELKMEASDGSFIELFTPSDMQKGFRILYFYDTDCSNCRIQSILLSNILATESFPVEFYAIYTGDNRESWTKYISERFDISNLTAKIFHLWDPEIDSDFQRKYGTLQTPRMFLVAPDGVIAGRGLDAYALSQMLHQIFDPVDLEYGSQESAALFDGIFAGGVPDASDVSALADQIAESTLPKGDTLMFRQMTGDLLYYLSTRSGEGIKEGLDYLIDTYILDNKVWRSADDSLKIVGFAGIMDDLLSKSKPGTKVADIKVPGLKVTAKGEKAYKKSLRKLGAARNIIIFYTEGCNICEAEKRAARDLADSDRDVTVMMINVDEIMRTDPYLASELFDKFDLSSLPYIIETNAKGLIQRRYAAVATK
jgi:hypothetical protein